MNHIIQIIIVDDSQIFLEGIQEFLRRDQDFNIAAIFQSGADLLNNIDDFDPDLILLDIEMPGLNGIETAHQLSRFGLELKLIALTLYSDNQYIDKLVEAGFRGIANKNEISEQLRSIMFRVMQGGLSFPETSRASE